MAVGDLGRLGVAGAAGGVAAARVAGAGELPSSAPAPASPSSAPAARLLLPCAARGVPACPFRPAAGGEELQWSGSMRTIAMGLLQMVYACWFLLYRSYVRRKAEHAAQEVKNCYFLIHFDDILTLK